MSIHTVTRLPTPSSVQVTYPCLIVVPHSRAQMFCTGMADLRADDIVVVIQLTDWRITVTTVNTRTCPDAARRVLNMTQAALKVRGATSDQNMQA